MSAIKTHCFIEQTTSLIFYSKHINHPVFHTTGVALFMDLLAAKAPPFDKIFNFFFFLTIGSAFFSFQNKHTAPFFLPPILVSELFGFKIRDPFSGYLVSV